MAGPGRTPKPPSQRVRRPSKVEEPQRRTMEAPPAPAPRLPGARTFNAATRKWYATWVSSPQAAWFTVTEWQRLAMLAHVVDAFWSDPSTARMAEIRLGEALLGATPIDRLRLRWDLKIAKPVQLRPGAEAEEEQRRSRILRLVDDDGA